MKRLLPERGLDPFSPVAYLSEMLREKSIPAEPAVLACGGGLVLAQATSATIRTPGRVFRTVDDSGMSRHEEDF